MSATPKRKIDWTRPIENKYGPCKFLHKLDNTNTRPYLVVGNNEIGCEQLFTMDEFGRNYYPDLNIRNVEEREVVYIPFAITPGHGLIRHRVRSELPQESTYETLKPYGIKLTIINDKPDSVELITLHPRD